MQSLRILVLHDGKPGHRSQSEGMARLIAAEEQRPCHIEFLRAKPRLKLLNRPLRRLASSGFTTAQKAVIAGHNLETLPQYTPDLIISFGGNTVALNIALSQYWQIPNILIGNHYGLRTDLVTAHATAFGNPRQANAIATRIALCKTNREACQQAGAEIQHTAGNTPLWTMLIGGDGSGYEYHTADWFALVEAMKALSASHGVRWLISTSRRTNSDGLAIVRKTCGPEICESAIWYGEEANQKSLDAYLGAAERIFCTEDSLSMLSESVAMDKAVISLRPASAQPKATHAKIIQHMLGVDLIERESIATLANYQPSPFHPAERYDAHLRSIYDRVRELGALPTPKQKVLTRPLAAEKAPVLG